MTQPALKGALIGVLGLVVATLLVLVSGAQETEPLPPVHVPAPADDGRPAALENASDLACAGCHAEITREWASTLHAMAWVDARYQKAMSKKRKPSSCQGCHIPEPIFNGAIGRKLRPRAETEGPRPDTDAEALAWNPRHFGISCVSCHQAPDGAMLGPLESSPEDEISGAHASRKGEAFGDGPLVNALCINCHRTNVGPVIGVAKDFEVTRQADKGLSCVGCHMAPVERSAAEGLDEDGQPWASPVRESRSHALQTPRDPVFLAEAFGLEGRRSKSGVELVVTNQAAHRIPGLRTRSMTFTVTAYDAAGKAVAQAEREYASDAYLPADGISLIPVRTTAAVASIGVRAVHDWTDVPEPVLFIDKRLEL
jgi:hypothetical protein